MVEKIILTLLIYYKRFEKVQYYVLIYQIFIYCIIILFLMCIIFVQYKCIYYILPQVYFINRDGRET